MYGMVNEAVRGLVIENFGEDTWTQIHSKAGTPKLFVPMESYDDAITYNLVGAATEVLGLEAEVILKTFGVYWVESVATKHYADMMNQTGVSFYEFLNNLDSMHQRMKSTFPDYQPPSFRVLKKGPQLLQVDYYSKREGLLPFVEGLISGLSKHFDQPIEIKHVPDDAHPLPCKRMLIELTREV
jgi:hypothetical protein